jgi:hypothetical protein
VRAGQATGAAKAVAQTTVTVMLAEDSAAPTEPVGRMEIALGPAVVRVGTDVDAAA